MKCVSEERGDEISQHERTSEGTVKSRVIVKVRKRWEDWKSAGDVRCEVGKEGWM